MARSPGVSQVEVHHPETETELVEVIADAVATARPLEITGCGSKRTWGHTLTGSATLSTRAFAGIRDYNPDELVLTCGAGMLLSDIEHILAGAGQRLPFAPGHWPTVISQTANDQTIGGVLSTNLAGATRFRRGAARDYLLGFSAVSGRGETFKAGGRVIKNVTGYDLCKLVCGAFGTLAVLTEVSLKVLPAPERTEAFRISTTDIDDATRIMHLLRRHSIDVAACWYVPEDTFRAWPGARASGVAAPGVIGVVEGTSAGMPPRIAQLHRDLAAAGLAPDFTAIADEAPLLTSALSALTPLTHDFDAASEALVRVSAAPTDLPALAGLASAGDVFRSIRGLVDCSGHWLWLRAPAHHLADLVGRLRAAAHGGDSTTAGRAMASVSIVHQPMGSAVPAFCQASPVVETLNRRIRAGFDPVGVLNPGRLFSSE